MVRRLSARELMGLGAVGTDRGTKSQRGTAVEFNPETPGRHSSALILLPFGEHLPETHWFQMSRAGVAEECGQETECS